MIDSTIWDTLTYISLQGMLIINAMFFILGILFCLIVLIKFKKI